MTRWRIITGDLRGGVLEQFPADYFHASLSDPPYGLRPDGRTATWDDVTGGVGFMGNAWDNAVPGVAFWRTVLRVLKPGAHVVAFSGTRTYHRATCAVEDAGFEVRDMVSWLYATGFPKSLDVSKAIDRHRDDESEVRAVCRFLRAAMTASGATARTIAERFGFHSRMVDHWAARDTDSQPTLPTWEQWEQLRSMLAFGDAMDAEVWRLNGRKGQPGEAWHERDVLGEHAGQTPGFVGHRFSAIDRRITKAANEESARWEGYGTALKPAHEPAVLARKPLAGTVAETCIEHGCGALAIDASRIAGAKPATGRGAGGQNGRYGPIGAVGVVHRIEDDGAGRWPANVTLDEAAAVMLDEQSANTSRFFFTAKASRREREAGCDDLPQEIAARYSEQGQGPLPQRTPRVSRPSGNHHPTVKPIALMTYLARLLLPPPGPEPRRILVPFSGSGSEMIGALLAGWDEVIGVESEPAYVAIAEARIRHWVDEAKTAKDAPARGRGKGGKRTTTFGDKTRECRVCGCRTAEPGAGGRWPACEHDDWAWVPRLEAEPKAPEPSGEHQLSFFDLAVSE